MIDFLIRVDTFLNPDTSLSRDMWPKQMQRLRLMRFITRAMMLLWLHGQNHLYVNKQPHMLRDDSEESNPTMSQDSKQPNISSPKARFYWQIHPISSRNQAGFAKSGWRRWSSNSAEHAREVPQNRQICRRIWLHWPRREFYLLYRRWSQSENGFLEKLQSKVRRCDHSSLYSRQRMLEISGRNGTRSGRFNSHWIGLPGKHAPQPSVSHLGQGVQRRRRRDCQVRLFGRRAGSISYQRCRRPGFQSPRCEWRRRLRLGRPAFGAANGRYLRAGS